MSFYIKFLDKPIPTTWLLPHEKGLMARVTIGDFSEDVTILTGYWQKEDYIAQWIKGVRRLINGVNGTKSAIVTAVHDPQNPKHGYIVQWWPMYKEGARVYVTNSALPYDKKGPPVDLANLYDYVEDRQIDTDDGEQPSEWITTIPELQEFLNSLQSSH